MTATTEWKVYTGTNAGTENPTTGSASNLNFMSVDDYDDTGTDYQTNTILIPDSGSNYSYERWFRIKFTGTFNSITNCRFFRSAGATLPTGVDLLAGSTETPATPVDTASTIATTTLSSWDELTEAISIQPSAGISNDGDYSAYGVLQLKVDSTTTQTGDIGDQTITVVYDES